MHLWILITASKKVKNLVFLVILNYTNIYSFTTKNINVHYWEIKPYIYLADEKVTGIFPKIFDVLNEECSTKYTVHYHKYDSYKIFLEQYSIHFHLHTSEVASSQYFNSTTFSSKQSKQHATTTSIIHSNHTYIVQTNHIKPTLQSNHVKSMASLRINNAISSIANNSVAGNKTFVHSQVWFPVMGWLTNHDKKVHYYSTLYADGLVMVVHLSKISLINRLLVGFRNCLLPLLATGVIMLFTGLCVWFFVSFCVQF